MENMKLNNNLECPMLGLGTFMLSPEDAYTSTLEALKMGYSLIDTANAYVMSVQLEEQSRIVELTEKIYFYQQKYGLVNMKMRIL